MATLPPRSRVRVERVVWPRDGREGCVWYEVTHPDNEVEYFRQPFTRGEARRDVKGRPLWGWNGEADPARLSLTGIQGKDSYDASSQRFRLHLTLRDGRVIIGDGCDAEVVP